MLSPDRGIRNLLPILEEEPDEVVLIADSDGIRVRSTAGAETSTSQALHHGIDPAMPSLGSSLQAMGAAGPSDISATHNPAGSGLSAKAGEPLESMESSGRVDAHESGDQSFRARPPRTRPPPCRTARLRVRWAPADQSTTGRTLLSRVNIRASKRATEMVRNPARH